MTPRLDEPWRLPGMEISVAAAPLATDWLWPRVVPPTLEINEHVVTGGLQLVDIDVADRGLFAKAAAAIAWAPSLAAIAATRVSAVHLISAAPGYDVSHSEPHWRDRIFVSVPDHRDEVGALRLAESVIHETLHLHLTELEAISPLVRDQAGTLASPWRPEPRSYGGVLHGAFVFAGLRAFFDIVTALEGSRAGHHLDQRRAEISKELAELDLVALRDGLTASGAALLSRLFQTQTYGTGNPQTPGGGYPAQLSSGCASFAAGSCECVRRRLDAHQFSVFGTSRPLYSKR